ncbi:MAG: hypothetical protein B6D72_10355 [gamma proteobacterium symbiont of Ctena orbiculata]|nr:DUF2784 domain-containing protein [Candidatus Thiodiazotropha taylori]PVV11414.1 MAG: hypothetical protein B6D72_10355 [gamma proteobacterium symbiont of Ctena orbiculata]MBT2997788.1 DUF2784 domain-containing protein [Candidatus Thiodiazotropha taylori]MBT3000443.1 DUF2784 domain-containing protein [Candidatus Thiodiazotropha taylori]MBV2107288.1 DUF2784 domain-containing protein [Candidatus Thiodiazotropha taylori]
MHTTNSIYLFAADAILLIHFLFVAFVVFGLVAIYIGHGLSWVWIRNFWFRIVHLVCIAIVVVQSWIGVLCPLTIWEMRLREKAGEDSYTGAFIQHWLQRILYYEAPDWVFLLVYTVFGIIVIASWFIVRPIRKRTQK